MFPIFQTGAKGQLVLNCVFEHLNLLEKDYFGLRYLDETNQTVSSPFKRYALCEKIMTKTNQQPACQCLTVFNHHLPTFPLV